APAIASQVDGAHTALADGRQDMKWPEHQPNGHAFEQLACLKARELAGLDQMIGHGISVLTLLERDVAQGLLKMGPVQHAAAQNGPEETLNRNRLRAFRHFWLLHGCCSLSPGLHSQSG